MSLQQAARITKRLERQRHERIWHARKYREQITTRLADDGVHPGSVSEELGAVDAQIEQADKERRDLNRERTHIIRKDARAVHLAYGFSRGVPYKAMEQKCWSPPHWEMVEYHIRESVDKSTYGTVLQQFAEWRDAAGKWEAPPAKPAKQRPSNWIKRTDLVIWGPPDIDEVPTSMGFDWRKRA